MPGDTRIIIVSSQTEMIQTMKNELGNRPYIDSIIATPRPGHVSSKMRYSGTNILIWDLDEHAPDYDLIKSFKRRYPLYTLYVSIDRAKYTLLPESGSDVFLQKPAAFSQAMAWKFMSSVTNFINTSIKRESPPNTRELVKMVGVSDRQKIIAIGASTGGTNALEAIFKQLPADIPPILVVQHMPGGFTKLFADRLNALYPQDIREAQSGDFLMRGRVLIAPADRHMRLVKQQSKLAVECYVGTRIHGVMPAADILFESVANVMGSYAVGVILSGMGSDGAKGLMHMKAAGCENIGQDEASCVVYGMPKAAKSLGAVSREYPLELIPDAILRLANK